MAIDLKDSLIIDAHSHIGLGFNSRYASIIEYEKIKQFYSINLSLLMPQPILDSTIIRNENLFESINATVYNEIMTSGIKNDIFFVPMVSPLYLTSNMLEKCIERYNPIALKIHYRNDNSYPDMISNEWIAVIKKYNIPLIVHTDFSMSNITEKDKYKNLNSALRWFEFFRHNEIKGYLTHGARLNPYVFEKIDSIDNIIIGIGPDLMLQDYSLSSLEQNGQYLQRIYDYVNPKKLAFDLDYNWNIDKDNNLDFNVFKRLENYWTPEELKLILGENSVAFFGENKIKKLNL